MGVTMRQTEQHTDSGKARDGDVVMSVWVVVVVRPLVATVVVLARHLSSFAKMMAASSGAQYKSPRRPPLQTGWMPAEYLIRLDVVKGGHRRATCCSPTLCLLPPCRYTEEAYYSPCIGGMESLAALVMNARSRWWDFRYLLDKAGIELPKPTDRVKQDTGCASSELPASFSLPQRVFTATVQSALSWVMGDVYRGASQQVCGLYVEPRPHPPLVPFHGLLVPIFSSENPMQASWLPPATRLQKANPPFRNRFLHVLLPSCTAWGPFRRTF